MSYLESLMSTGETIQLATRQHWIKILRSILVNGLAFLLAVMALGFFGRLSTQPGRALAGVGVIVAVAVMVWSGWRLMTDLARWWSRQYVVTTRRVLEVEGVFNKSVRDSNLDKVNDLVLNQSALGRLLGYGDIEIITGSDVGVNRLDKIARPLEFKRKMLDNKEDFDSLSRHGSGPEGDHGPIDVMKTIQDLAALRDRGVLSPEEFERKKADLLARL